MEETKMKKLIKILLSVFLLFLFGCSKNSNDSINPIGINPTGSNNNVTFQVSIQQDQQNGLYFHFIPSVNVIVTKVEATINNNTSSVNGDPNSTITTTEGFSVSITATDPGDNWTFKITGKVASNNSDFTSTVNYIVPANFGGGTGSVSFEISSQAGQQGGVDFLFKPSIDVKITKVDVEMGGATDVVTGDGTTVYSANNWYVLAGYNAVSSGQQWNFTFTGNIASNNQGYNVTVNYTIP